MKAIDFQLMIRRYWNELNYFICLLLMIIGLLNDFNRKDLTLVYHYNDLTLGYHCNDFNIYVIMVNIGYTMENRI